MHFAQKMLGHVDLFLKSLDMSQCFSPLVSAAKLPHLDKSLMSQLKPEIQTQRMTETLQDVKKIQFWLDKAVAWSQNKSPDTLRDISRHLRKLCAYLQQLLIHVNSLVRSRC